MNTICYACGDDYTLRDGHEPTRFCDGCAQIMVEAYRKELRRCAAIFRRYAAMHLAKGTDDGKRKAMANQAHADRIKTLLAQ